MLFSKTEIGSIPNQKITFKRIRIATRNEDGSIGDLVFSTPANLLSFGLQETRDLVTNQINGYVFPICLWSQHGSTPEEKKFTDIFSSIADKCKEYLLQNKEEIEKYDLDMADLKKFNPLFWKMEKGKIVEGRGPMLYVKVMYNKRSDKVTTLFIDENTNQEIDPFRLLNKRCNATVAIKFESIFIGNKISLQVKLYEAVVKVVDNTIRGLLRPNAIKRDESTDQTRSTLLNGEDEECEEVVEEEEEDVDVDDTPTPTPTPTVPAVEEEDEEGEEDEQETPPPAPVPTDKKKRGGGKSKK